MVTASNSPRGRRPVLVDSWAEKVGYGLLRVLGLGSSQLMAHYSKPRPTSMVSMKALGA